MDDKTCWKINIIQGLIGSDSEIEVVPGGGVWKTYEERIQAYVSEAKGYADSVSGLASRVSNLESKQLKQILACLIYLIIFQTIIIQNHNRSKNL